MTLYLDGMKSRVSSKGQVTLPAVVRERLGLGAGTPVQFEFRDGGVLLKKGATGPHPVDQVFGVLKLDKPVDELLDEMRGPRPKERRRRAGGRRRR